MLMLGLDRIFLDLTTDATMRLFLVFGKMPLVFVT